jgi:hypothetical protein
MVELFEEGLVVQVSNTKVDRKSGTRSLELFMKMFFTRVCGGNFLDNLKFCCDKFLVKNSAFRVRNKMVFLKDIY